MNISKQKILIIAAHPDDEILGCGGMMLKALKLKSEIFVLFLGEGVSARYDLKNSLGKDSIKAREIREKEAKKVLNYLKIKNYVFEHRLCTRFDELPILNIVKSIENIINKFKPSIIFTHNPSEVNIDHKITYKATEIATRPINRSFLKEIYSYEIPCSGNWKFSETFKPNVFLDIEDVWKKKIKAIKFYKNELRKYPHPRSLKGVEIISRYRGLQSGIMLAEAFRLERSIL